MSEKPAGLAVGARRFSTALAGTVLERFASRFSRSS